MEIHKDRYGVKHCIIEAQYRKLLNLDPKTEGYTHVKLFFNNWELPIRGLEAEYWKNEEFGDLLTLFLTDKLFGDLRRCLARAHGKTTWTLEDFLQERTTSYGTRKNQRSKLTGKITITFDSCRLDSPSSLVKVIFS